MRLFLNATERAYLREMAKEFDLSPSIVKEELRQLSAAGLLTSEKNGRSIYYSANTDHPLFPELNSMVRKALGMEHILESILRRLGNLDRAILIDDYAEGKDTGLIDIVLIGDIDEANLNDLIAKAERYIQRKIRPLVIRPNEKAGYREILESRPKLVLWSRARRAEIARESLATDV